MKLPAGQNSFSFGFYQAKYQKISLLIIWVFLQCFFLWKNGIVTSLEAVKYIDQASVFLATGKYSSGNFLFYSVQILLIALCLKLKISYLFLVIFQMLANGISIVCFYKLVMKLSQNNLFTFVATLYFLLFAYYHLFNTYLFTESLFFSFSVIYTYVLFTRKKFNAKIILVIVLFLSLLYFTRPTGIFFIPATFVFIAIKFYSKKALRIIAVSFVAAIAGSYFLFNYSIGSGGELDFLLPYLDERIICGVPTISEPHKFTVPVNKNSIEGLLYIISHNFQLFFRLGMQRLGAFFGIYRPFYSTIHNIIGSSYFYLMYIVIIAGVRNLFKQHKAEVWFLLCNIGLMAATVMLSCDEWSNRFILAVIPFILLLGVISLTNYKKKFHAAGNNG